MGVEPKLKCAAWWKGMIARLLSGQRADGGFGVHERLRSLRRPDDTWGTGGRRYWRLSGRFGVEAARWGDAHQVVTPIALAMLQ